MVFSLPLNILKLWVESLTMPNLPNLNSLGKLCGSGRSDESIIQDRARRKNSVRRMSIIEDGNIAEVLYLIPKQSMMEQLPFLNPSEYVILEKMAPPAMGPGSRWVRSLPRIIGCKAGTHPGGGASLSQGDTHSHTHTYGHI